MAIENFYDKKESAIQNLHFSYLETKFNSLDKELDLKALNFFTENGKYNNSAYLFSDECNITTKYAVFQNINVILDMKEFTGSILKQLDQVLLHIDVVNRELNVINGIERQSQKNYPERALKEVLCNCFCHQSYEFPNTVIRCFPECIDISNKGDKYISISKENINDGIVCTKNSIVYNVFKILGYTSFYAKEQLNGLQGIFLDYKDEEIEFRGDCIWKIVLPNRNFETIRKNMKDKIVQILENQSLSKEEQANRILSIIQ